MSEPYLILHKVRGEPAFDIAHKLMIGDAEGWVLSSCGYRAYPWWHKPLGMLGRESWAVYCEDDPIKDCDPMPSDARDCFACNDRPIHEDTYTVKAKAAGLLESLGLIKPVIVERRD